MQAAHEKLKLTTATEAAAVVAVVVEFPSSHVERTAQQHFDSFTHSFSSCTESNNVHSLFSAFFQSKKSKRSTRTTKREQCNQYVAHSLFHVPVIFATPSPYRYKLCSPPFFPPAMIKSLFNRQYTFSMLLQSQCIPHEVRRTMPGKFLQTMQSAGF